MSFDLSWREADLPALDRRPWGASLARLASRGLDPVLGYRRRWRLGEALSRATRGDPGFAPIVVAGCGRSGTTLVARLLGSHPLVFCGVESSVFLERVSSPAVIASRFGLDAGHIAALRLAGTQPAFIRRFAEACLAHSGKRIWAEKTPENVLVLPRIRSWFPEARILLVVRDGRDVACSLRQQPWMKLGARAGDPVADLRTCLLYWQARAEAGLAWRDDAHTAVLRYEDLVADPEAALSRVLPRLGLAFSPLMLDGHAIDHGAVGRWRQDLPERHLAGTLARLAPTLNACGYAA
ncbi:sulfotransferase family protein [Zavarzinia sp. CC-PAN008]|uniref:sulfotransferase family protein n=1 Tax=Zavarzinia sp. CC-PAN008 TaxID=3243332 RepID=UPI003F748DA4